MSIINFIHRTVYPMHHFDSTQTLLPQSGTMSFWDTYYQSPEYAEYKAQREVAERREGWAVFPRYAVYIVLAIALIGHLPSGCVPHGDYSDHCQVQRVC